MRLYKFVIVLLTPVTVDQAREKILKVHIQTLLHGAKGRHVSWLVNVDCLVREATVHEYKYNNDDYYIIWFYF